MRRSGPDRPERPAKRKRSVDVTADSIDIREGDGFVNVSIPSGQSVVFEGSAVLEVTSGCISVYGALVTPERGPIRITASSKHGRALLLTALTAESQAPFALSIAPVQAVLHAATASANTPAKGFTVTDSSSNLNSGSSGVEGPVWLVPQQWSQAIDTLSLASAASVDAAAAAGQPPAPLVIAVTGSKGSGKSALARLLANSLLNSCPTVCFMDLDPGQPELTPAGILSLHELHQPLFGPAHMQQQQPVSAYFQGDVSSQSEPGRYLQAVQALCAKYYSRTAATAAGQAGQLPPPLVINTPGWITGLGLELLGELLRCAGAAYVLNLQTSNSKKNLPEGCWWLDGEAAAAAGAGNAVLPEVLQLPSCAAAAAAAPSGTTDVAAGGSCFTGQSGDTVTTANPGSGKSSRSVSAVEARALSMLAWSIRAINNCTSGNGVSSSGDELEQELVAVGTDHFASAAAGLAAAVPFEVSLQDIKLELLHAEVAYSELGFALNGALVGLNKSSSRDDNQSQQGPAEGALQECLGLGLIRAVDGRKGVLYVLTDLPGSQLQHVDTLVVGRLELPDKLQVSQAVASPYQGLYCMTSTATGAGVIKSRNNLLRASLMRA